MINETILVKMKQMLKELGWSDKIIDQYCRETFDDGNETKNAVAEPNTTYQEPLNVLFKV